MVEITAEILWHRWLPAFVLTLVVEIPLYVLLVRGFAPAARVALVGALIWNGLSMAVS